MPFPSYEVRWFFEHSRNDRLQPWFKAATPFVQDANVGEPPRLDRQGNEPDIYALLPGHADMGIKWREGLLQVKGRVADCGIQRFGGRHEGRVERWVKWSYDELPGAWQRLFTEEATDLPIAAVHKSRLLRKVCVDPINGGLREVHADEAVQRAVVIELTDIRMNDRAWCSLGFEAFPDDSAMPATFTATVSAFLESLDHAELKSVESLSYPAWLERNARG